MLLPSDQALVDQLPPEVLDKVDFNETLAFLTAEGLAQTDVLPDDYAPQEVEFYSGDFQEATLEIYPDQSFDVTPEFLADGLTATFAVVIDNVTRFVQVHNEVLVDTLGNTKLPRLLIDPVTQADFLVAQLRSAGLQAL